MKAENSYTEARTARIMSMRDKLYQEHLGHMKQTDEKPAYPHGKDWLYYTKTIEGLSYKINCRKPANGPESDKEVVLLDENAVAQGHAHADVPARLLAERTQIGRVQIPKNVSRRSPLLTADAFSDFALSDLKISLKCYEKFDDIY